MKTNQALPKRSEISQSDAWKPEHLFKNNETWQKEYDSISKKIPTLSNWKGKLSETADTLFEALQFYDALSQKTEQLYVYANMRFHEDSANPFYQSMANKSEMLVVQLSSESAFIAPEILSINAVTLESHLTALNGIQIYSHFIENITRQKNHTLSSAEEALLAKTEDLASASHQIFVMLNDADIQFPYITDEKGNEVELTKGRYTSFLESNDRNVRQQAFEALYDTYLKQKNTLAACYYANVKKDVFYAKVRNYSSSLLVALDNDRISQSVYETLIDTVHKYLPLLHRYIALRKKLLGLEELHMYDLYAPLVSEINWDISYEEAKKNVLEGLSSLGEEYSKNLQEGFTGGWIDVYENQGKRGGAYSWGAFPGHPYVLLNYNETINSMFTLAHEMGHALHSHYTWNKQPYIYSGHKIFVAEVASTVNEALLMEHLLKTTTDKKEKAFLINYFMEQFRGTLFRQTMFAEFEKITHDMVERGEPLTCEGLMELYHKLNIQYFGNDIIIDDKIDIEWARIPHFYNAFYVYQYATGYSAAITLSRKILTEGQPAVEKYLDFLSKGCSEYSIELLKGAGVDMTSSEPLEKAMAVFEGLLHKMEELI